MTAGVLSLLHLPQSRGVSGLFHLPHLPQSAPSAPKPEGSQACSKQPPNDIEEWGVRAVHLNSPLDAEENLGPIVVRKDPCNEHKHRQLQRPRERERERERETAQEKGKSFVPCSTARNISIKLQHEAWDIGIRAVPLARKFGMHLDIYTSRWMYAYGGQ